MSLPGYLTYSRNRENKNAGGIATSVLLDDASSSVRVEEGKDENEFILTRHSQFQVPVNVLNVYGQQECRMTKNDIDDHWNELIEVINSVEDREESLVWVGDFNRHIGQTIPGNDNHVSYGGKLLN